MFIKNATYLKKKYIYLNISLNIIDPLFPFWISLRGMFLKLWQKNISDIKHWCRVLYTLLIVKCANKSEINLLGDNFLRMKYFISLKEQIVKMSVFFFFTMEIIFACSCNCKIIFCHEILRVNSKLLSFRNFDCIPVSFEKGITFAISSNAIHIFGINGQCYF